MVLSKILACLKPPEAFTYNLLEKRRKTQLFWVYICGQEHVKRVMEVAAAGGHNALLTWPAGSR